MQCSIKLVVHVSPKLKIEGHCIRLQSGSHLGPGAVEGVQVGPLVVQEKRPQGVGLLLQLELFLFLLTISEKVPELAGVNVLVDLSENLCPKEIQSFSIKTRNPRRVL